MANLLSPFGGMGATRTERQTGAMVFDSVMAFVEDRNHHSDQFSLSETQLSIKVMHDGMIELRMVGKALGKEAVHGEDMVEFPC